MVWDPCGDTKSFQLLQRGFLSFPLSGLQDIGEDALAVEDSDIADEKNSGEEIG